MMKNLGCLLGLHFGPLPPRDHKRILSNIQETTAFYTRMLDSLLQFSWTFLANLHSFILNVKENNSRQHGKSLWNSLGKAWLTRESSRPHGKNLWKQFTQRKENFQEYIRWKVGKRDGVRLWEDQWLEEGTLRARFPHIYMQLHNRKTFRFMIL